MLILMPRAVCRECNEPVPAGSATCPNCGAQRPEPSRRLALLLALVVLVVLPLVLFWIANHAR